MSSGTDACNYTRRDEDESKDTGWSIYDALHAATNQELIEELSNRLYSLTKLKEELKIFYIPSGVVLNGKVLYEMKI